MAHDRHSIGAETADRASRGGAPRRGLLSRAIPGSVVVVAALTVPEFSMGAGNIDDDSRRAKPPQPPAPQGQSFGKIVQDSAKAPFAGVRYGGVMAIREASWTPSAKPSHDSVTVADPAPPALAVAPAISKAKRLEGGAGSVTVSSDPLDEAASFAATLLDSMATQPGLLPATPVETPPVNYARPEPIDMAASYAAMTLDRFAAGAVADEIEQVVVAPTHGDGSPDPIFPAAEFSAPPPEAAPLMLDEAAEFAAPLELEKSEPAPPTMSEAADAAALDGDPVAEPAAPVADMAASTPPSAAPTLTVHPVAQPAAATLAASPAPREPVPMAYASFGFTKAERGAPLAFDLRSQLAARVDGKLAGALDFRQTAAGLSIRLGSIVSLLSDRYDPDEVARIVRSPASNAYLSLADLQAQGVAISYDPLRDEFQIGRAGTRAAQPHSVAMAVTGEAPL